MVEEEGCFRKRREGGRGLGGVAHRDVERVD